MTTPVYDPEVYGEPVYSDALIDPEVYGEAPLADDAATGGSFTADAVLLRAIASGLTTDAVLRGTADGSYTADAVIGVGGPVSGSLTADAVLLATQSGSFVADAISSKAQTSALIADALIVASVPGSLTVDAVVWRVVSASLTVNAVQRRTTSAGLLADSTIRRTITGSFTADALIVPWFTANAVLRKAQTGSFTVKAWIYAPRADPEGPGEPGETPLVSIIVDGEDVTADAVLSDATFTMMVNGAVGTCSLRIRDDDHVRHFVSGSEITVDIDGKRRFGGYLMQPRRLLAFPVEDTTDPNHPSRFHVLTGVDYNILLTKRVVYDKANPANLALRRWDVGSHDDVVIKYVFDHYTDLGADGVDYSGVTHIASPNPDKAGVIASGGLRFVDAMKEINRLISGVFYIDAYKRLNFVDVDTPNAQFGLSDAPGAGEVGYRELTQVSNGSALVNDAMVWGAGLGMQNGKVVFARVQDAASIFAHGRWQMGEYTTALYKQASVNLRADTIVNGTPQSKRGGKDDQESWKIITYENTFEVGQKVAIESEVFGKSDVVPIRRLTMTFPSKKRPKFDLTLSHEIDEPWNLFEFWFPKIAWDPFGFDIDIGDGHLPESGECVCGITDTFTRIVPAPGSSYPDYLESGWGFSDAGAEWHRNFSGPSAIVLSDIDGAEARIRVGGNNGSPSNLTEWLSSSFLAGDVDVAFQVRFADPTVTGYQKVVIFTIDVDYLMWRSSSGSFGECIGASLEWQSGVSRLGVITDKGDDLTPATLTYQTVVIAEDTNYMLRWQRVGTATRAKFWVAADPEPGTWTVEGVITGDHVLSVDKMGLMVISDVTSGNWTKDVYFDNLDITGVDRCAAVQFDDFNRTVASGWGIGLDGGAWFDAGPGDGDRLVGNGYGLIEHATALAGQTYTHRLQPSVGGGLDPAPWNGDFSMLTRFIATTIGAGTGYRLTAIWVCPGVQVAGDGPVIEYWNNVVGGPSIGFTYANTADPASVAHTWVEGNEYYLRWERSSGGTINRVRVWDVGATEPASWDIDSTTVDPVLAPESFAILKQGGDNVNPESIEFDFIDFDYDGRPCYLTTTCDVGSYLVSAWEWFDGGGDGEETSQYWGFYNDGTVFLDSQAEDPELTPDWVEVRAGTATGFTEIVDYISGGPFTIKADVYLPAMGPTEQEHAAIIIKAGSTTRVSFSLPRYRWGAFFAGTTVFDDYPYTNWAAGWHELRIDVSSTSASFYIDGGLVQTIAGTLDMSTLSNLHVQLSDFGVPQAGLMSIRVTEITRTDGTPAVWCTTSSTPAGSGSPSSGGGRADIPSLGTITVYPIGQAYVPGSVRVFINGYFQIPGTDFTESDPVAGEITFTSAPVAGMQISVFYEVAGV